MLSKEIRPAIFLKFIVLVLFLAVAARFAGADVVLEGPQLSFGECQHFCTAGVGQLINDHYELTCSATIKNYGNQTAANVIITVDEATDIGIAPSPNDLPQPPNIFSVSGGSLSAMSWFASPGPYNFGRTWSINSLAPGESASISGSISFPQDKHFQANFAIESASPGVGSLSGQNVGCGAGANQSPGGPGGPPGPGGPGFSLDCNPLTASITQGSDAAYEVSLIADSGFSAPVTLIAENIPPPATYGFSPGNIVGGGASSSSIAHISNTANVAPNTYTIRFVGSARGLASKTVDCNLVVNSATHVLTGHVIGSGSISSTPVGSPALTNCSPNCSSTYTTGQSVTIMATPQAGATFAGWQDGPCSGTGACTIVMNSDISVTARFTGGEGGSGFNLTGKVIGSGSISASPAGSPPMSACTSSCTSNFSSGQSVNVTATADSSASFTGWQDGPCSGTGNCVITMNSDVSVTANFRAGSDGCRGSGCSTGGGPCTGANCGSPPGNGCVGTGCPPGGTPPGGVSSVPAPTNVIANNGTCERITVRWQSSAGTVDGYNVYRAASPTSWTRLNANPLINTSIEYIDSTAVSGASYYYAVAAIRDGQESAKTQPAVSPVSVRACAPDLSTSDKDVTAVDGQANIIDGHLSIPCSNVTDAIKAVDEFHEDNAVTFAVNICNTGVRPAEKLSFVDHLINLKEPATGWNATYNGVAIVPVVSGTAPNQILTFENLGTIPAPVFPDTVEFRTIIFHAVVASPKPGTLGEYRFQNQGDILMDGNPAKHAQTPPYIFNAGPTIPKRNEAQL